MSSEQVTSILSLLNYQLMTFSEIDAIEAPKELALRRLLNEENEFSIDVDGFKYLGHLVNVAGVVGDKPPEKHVVRIGAKNTQVLHYPKGRDIEGWSQENFLAIRVLFLIDTYLQKSNNQLILPSGLQNQNFLQYLRNEIFVTVNAYRMLKIYLRIATAEEAYHGLMEKVSQDFVAFIYRNLENVPEICIPCGTKSHAIYLYFTKLAENLVIRVDNLIARSSQVAQEQRIQHGVMHDYAKPRTVAVIPWHQLANHKKALVEYLQNVMLAKVGSDTAALDVVYAVDSLPCGDIKDNWPYSLAQTVDNCVVRNFNAAMEMRANALSPNLFGYMQALEICFAAKQLSRADGVYDAYQQRVAEFQKNVSEDIEASPRSAQLNFESIRGRTGVNIEVEGNKNSLPDVKASDLISDGGQVNIQIRDESRGKVEALPSQPISAQMSDVKASGNVFQLTGNFFNPIIGGSVQQDEAEMLRKIDATLAKLVTAQQVADEDFDNELSLYVPIKGSYSQLYQNPFDIYQLTIKFLQPDDTRRVMLLLGGFGSGKTMYCQHLVRMLAKAYVPAEGRVPLYMSLPQLNNVTENLIEQLLVQYGFNDAEIAYLKTTYKFTLILDGLDEVSSLKQKLVNLYVNNHMYEWDVKVIITCRTTYLLDVTEYQRYFMPYAKGQALRQQFVEVHVMPLSPSDKNEYINNYIYVKGQQLRAAVGEHKLDAAWLSSEIYHHYINRLPGMLQLVNNPFLLRIVMLVLPETAEKYLKEILDQQRKVITSMDLYDQFINRWFDRQADKLIWSCVAIRGNIQAEFLAFSKALAAEMKAQNVSQVEYRRKTRFDTQATVWQKFFDDTDPELNAIRSGCPLKWVNGVYSFLHHTLYEYFLSRDLFETLLRAELQGSEAGQSQVAAVTKHRSELTDLFSDSHFGGDTFNQRFK